MTTPFTSCCENCDTLPPRQKRGAGLAPCPSPRSVDAVALAGELSGLLGHPGLLLDGVDREDLGGGVAELVERDLAGDAGDADLADLVDRRLADLVVDLGLVLQRDLEGLDDDVGRVV